MSSRDFAALLSEPEPAPRLASVGAEPNRSSSVQLDLDAALRLWLRRGESPIRVKPVRCFPWSAPGELVSLRDEGGHEQLLVETLQDLDALSARALETALLGSGFVLDVQRVESIEEDYEIRLWQTETRHGRRTFQTKLDEWPWASPDGGYLVRDLAGDLFRIPPLEALDERSRELLWAYVG